IAARTTTAATTPITRSIRRRSRARYSSRVMRNPEPDRAFAGLFGAVSARAPTSCVSGASRSQATLSSRGSARSLSVLPLGPGRGVDCKLFDAGLAAAGLVNVATLLPCAVFGGAAGSSRVLGLETGWEGVAGACDRLLGDADTCQLLRGAGDGMP